MSIKTPFCTRSIPILACSVVLIVFSFSSNAVQSQTVQPKKIQSGFLTIRYHDPSDRTQIAFVFKVWHSAIQDLKRIGLQAKPTTLEAFSSAHAFKQATNEPAFIAASTINNVIRTQRLRALHQRGILAFTIRHEAFHSVQPSSLPRWLSEGLARHFSGEDQTDSQKPSGLEHISPNQLEIALLGRDQRFNTKAAYLEATRRARRFLRQHGWQAALDQH